MSFARTLFIAAIAGTLTGCATSPIATGPGPMYVPTGVLTGSDASARFVLPTNSLAEAEIPRWERSAMAPDIGYTEAFSDYTYDIQPIGVRNGYGYRYRSVLRVGGSLP